MTEGKRENLPFPSGEENATMVFGESGGAEAPSAAELRRRLGLPEGNQAPQDTFLAHGKVVYIECDMRTFAKEDPRNSDMRISRPATAEQTLNEDAAAARLISRICI